MYKTYWISFVFLFALIVFSASLIVLIRILQIKGMLSKKFFAVSTVILIITIILSVYSIIPYIKDYSIISKECFFEEDAVVIEFTYIRDDPDGNGQTQYSSPKFFIESKGEYVVFNVRNVEVGKKYRIRYLPNTKICEVLYCIE